MPFATWQTIRFIKTSNVEMFDVQEIDELGLTRLDRKVLEYLGVSTVAQTVGEDDGTIENIVEPWTNSVKGHFKMHHLGSNQNAPL